MATGVWQGVAPSNGATVADVGKMLGVTAGLTSKLQTAALVPRFQGLGVTAGLTSKLQTAALVPRFQGLGVTAGLTSKLQTGALLPRFQGLGVTAGLTSKLQTGALVPRFQGLGVTAGLTSKLQTAALVPPLQGLGVAAGLTSKLQTGALLPRLQGLGVTAGLTSKLQTGALVPRFQGLGITAGPTTKLKTPALAPDLGGLGITASFAGILEVPTFRVLNPSSALAAIQLPARRVSKVRDGGLGELARYADYLEHHPLKEYRDAGAFLRKAIRGYGEALVAEDGYQFADVVHWAIGALEEVARQQACVKGKTLGKALKELEASGALSWEERKGLEEIYELRSQRPGIGHGAGGAPEYVATFTLSRVRMGLKLLLPLLGFPDER